MREFLAAQIPPQMMFQMVCDNCIKPLSLSEGGRNGNFGAYEPMINIFDKVDRLVGITNATHVKNGKDLKVEEYNDYDCTFL